MPGVIFTLSLAYNIFRRRYHTVVVLIEPLDQCQLLDRLSPKSIRSPNSRHMPWFDKSLYAAIQTRTNVHASTLTVLCGYYIENFEILHYIKTSTVDILNAGSLNAASSHADNISWYQNSYTRRMHNNRSNTGPVYIKDTEHRIACL